MSIFHKNMLFNLWYFRTNFYLAFLCYYYYNNKCE